MKNREKYAQEIIDILLDGFVAVDKSGKPMQCTANSCCQNCLFFGNKAKGCGALLKEWLNAECEDDKAKEKAIIHYVIAYLNIKTGRHYRETNKATVRCIKARLKEGYNVSDFEKVIDIKKAEWMGTEYEKYLAPETLFGNKFDKYLNQPVKKQTENKRSSKWGD